MGIRIRTHSTGYSSLYTIDFCFRKVVFDLILDGQVFISELDTLEKAVCSFLHICFVANIKYPVGSGMLCTFLQRCVAKLDENGTTANNGRKDQSSPLNKAFRPFRKIFYDFCQKVYLLITNKS
jgi:hypothetical protein